MGRKGKKGRGKRKERRVGKREKGGKDIGKGEREERME